MVEIEKPQYVLFLVTNSTWFCLCDCQMQILWPCRSGYCTGMSIGPQEEINRIVTDQISDHLFVTDETCRQNLGREGIDETKFLTSVTL